MRIKDIDIFVKGGSYFGSFQKLSLKHNFFDPPLFKAC